ncbi:UDP-N-acetylmuramoyl-L-alanine--D-glutamate ligase [Aerococcaceae bacterium DSM 111176]|nr:UDP-N-acetylmuramoyl-L-alanine--D-glutamate ligase [Aerococcaceae bacterium DSM 111176]
MKSTQDLTNKHILVLGYAMTGKSVVDFLVKQGANVTLNDRGDLSTDPSVSFLIEKGVTVVDGGHPLELLDGELDFIVKNPGIPYSIPILKEAMKRQIPIYTDIELSSRYAAGSIVGITGSNGKTTTTALLYEILKNRPSGKAHLAGNIGIPTLDIVQTATDSDIIVMEVSSFQLEGTEQFHPQIAVLTNIFEAHLDYHGNRENYVNAKLKLIANQTANDYLIYNYDQPELHELVADAPSVKVPFSVANVDEYVRSQGVYVEDGVVYYQGKDLFETSLIQIPGEHNVQNVIAAVAVAMIEGVDLDSIKAEIHKYQGMPHRIQPIGEFGGRRYYNDSKATNVTATITALDSFEEPIVYIGGGLDRGNTFEELKAHLKYVKVAALYGETKEKMRESFVEAGVPVVEVFETLEEATAFADREAEVGEVVLFSPSCASWDQFKNYEIRGETFVEAVKQLNK